MYIICKTWSYHVLNSIIITERNCLNVQPSPQHRNNFENALNILIPFLSVNTGCVIYISAVRKVILGLCKGELFGSYLHSSDYAFNFLDSCLAQLGQKNYQLVFYMSYWWVFFFYWWVIVHQFSYTMVLEAFMNFICPPQLPLSYYIFLRTRYFVLIWGNHF